LRNIAQRLEMKPKFKIANLILEEDSGIGSNSLRTTPENPLQRTVSSDSEPLLRTTGKQRQTLLPSLGTIELRERSECEKIICRGLETFLEVGRALATIRDKRLYRDRYGTFEEYSRQRWEFSKTHANRLIEAAAVAAVLTPIGVKLKCESQVRPLVGLEPMKISAAWKRAEEIAGDGEVTAKFVRQAAEEFKKGSNSSLPISTSKKSSLIPTGLKVAFKLLYQAEEDAKEKDLMAVLESLRKLRKCLLDFAQFG
jgi:hypothetical protein